MAAATGERPRWVTGPQQRAGTGAAANGWVTGRPGGPSARDEWQEIDCRARSWLPWLAGSPASFPW